ncbi:MAG: hypothetical protein O7E52_20020 [Candidatus Poribacteria bacterium]|nr:hypothetical protein [Candidatus Poribacteria bacterium]
MTQIFRTYTDLLERVEGAGRPTRVLGHTPDGSPIVSVRTGGEKTPAIFITAGSHSTEHAGVSAAVELIDQLDTQHQVYIMPTRDPIGLNGYAYALSLGLGEVPQFDSFEDVEAILRDAGEIFYDEDGMLLSLIGDYGYASSRPAAQRPHPQWAFYNKLQDIHNTQPDLLEAFKYRRLYMTPGQPGVEGTGNFGRAYTLIISLEGEVLHLNRFHDTAWAPVEVRCTRRLMAEIQPGITFDLHESQLMEDCYWLSARHQPDAENEAWEQRAAQATIKAIADSGAVLASDDDVLGGVPIEETWFTRSEKGVYWLDATVRGEGLNLADYASRVYGLAFGTEMGMYGSFEKRVSLGMLTVQSAVRVFEQRYR